MVHDKQTQQHSTATGKENISPHSRPNHLKYKYKLCLFTLYNGGAVIARVLYVLM